MLCMSETKNLLKGSTSIDEILHFVQYDKNKKYFARIK